MQRSRIQLSTYQAIEASKDWNGPYFIAYSNGASLFFRDVVALRKWLKLPKGIPSRDSFDRWIASIEAADQERAAKKKPLPQEGLSDELLATGFGPEVHEEEDPTANTKMIT